MSYPENIFFTRTIRRVVWITLVVVFFCTSPLVIAYTIGYRYSWPDKRILPTGAISIDGRPEDATVSINHIPLSGRMPLRLTNYAPDTYHVSIAKPGYKTWEKDITVTSKETTYIKHITLFSNTLPTKMIPLADEQASETISLSPAGEAALLSRHAAPHSTIELIDLPSQKRTIIDLPTVTGSPQFDWSPFSPVALIRQWYNNEQHLTLISSLDGEIRNTITLPATSTFFLQWTHEDTTGGVYLHWYDEHTIIYLSPLGEVRKITLPTSTSSLWYHSNKQLWQYNAQTHRLFVTPDTSGGFSIDPQYDVTKIIDINNNRILLQTTAGILKVSEKNPRRETILVPGTSYEYNKSTEEWIVWSPWELWTIYNSGKIALLYRVGDHIQLVKTFDPYGVLIIATDKEIIAFNPGYYTIQPLFTGNHLEQISVNQKNEIIYFVGQVGNQRGVFEMKATDT